MGKKHKCPEFENHERWLVAFADMMTLLFALFVVLYSIANVETEKLRIVSKSIQKAFGMEETEGKEGETTKGDARTEGMFDKIKGDSNRDLPKSSRRSQLSSILSINTKKLETELQLRLSKSQGKSEQKSVPSLSVTKDTDGIKITLLAKHFFNPGEATLNADAQQALDIVADTAKQFQRTMRVEGHTDSLPYLNKPNQSITNWELSGNRAATVVRYFIERHEYDPGKIYAAGYADTKPAAPNNTPANRALNRRVVIKLLYDNMDEILGPEPETKP